MARRGFGVVGALDPRVLRTVAREAEHCGFSTLWVNDTPRGDGLEALAVAAEVTTSIGLAVGVIAVDRRPPAEIARSVRELRLPLERLVLGIGAGSTRVGGLRLVRDAVQELHALVDVPVVVGALGPKMCRLAGEHADGVLLNWLTPEQARVSSERVRSAAQSQAKPRPVIAGYVRTALGDAALPKLRQEAARYERIPQYARHFEAMGVSGVDASVSGADRREIQLGLDAFGDAMDEVVDRAITAEETDAAYLALLEASSP